MPSIPSIPAERRQACETLWPWIALQVTPGVSGAAWRRLVERFGDARAVLAAPERGLVDAGLPPGAARALATGVAREAATLEVERALAAGVRIVTWLDADYPSALRTIRDAPPYLYVRGTLDPPDTVAVAVVGARAASVYGRDVAERLGWELAAAGVTVVSGLAHGVDGAAHRGALAGGGRTVAVLGSGIDVVYPREHVALAGAMSARGALVSEFGMQTPPRAAHFPRRNRIISGLARAVVVVEATERSGSLITARWALEQGRDVLAVPGPVTAPRSRGTHLLIRAGAALVTCAADVLAEIGVHARGGAAAASSGGGIATATVDVADVPHARRVAAVLADGVADVDTLVVRTGLTPRELLRILLELELAGAVHQLPGGGYALPSAEPGRSAYAAHPLT